MNNNPDKTGIRGYISASANKVIIRIQAIYKALFGAEPLKTDLIHDVFEIVLLDNSLRKLVVKELIRRRQKNANLKIKARFVKETIQAQMIALEKELSEQK